MIGYKRNNNYENFIKIKMFKKENISEEFKNTYYYENLDKDDELLPINIEYYHINKNINSVDYVIDRIKFHLFHGEVNEPDVYKIIDKINNNISLLEIEKIKATLPEEIILVQEILLLINYKKTYGEEAIKKSFINLLKFALSNTNINIDNSNLIIIAIYTLISINEECINYCNKDNIINNQIDYTKLKLYNKKKDAMELLIFMIEKSFVCSSKAVLLLIRLENKSILNLLISNLILDEKYISLTSIYLRNIFKIVCNYKNKDYINFLIDIIYNHNNEFNLSNIVVEKIINYCVENDYVDIFIKYNNKIFNMERIIILLNICFENNSFQCLNYIFDLHKSISTKNELITNMCVSSRTILYRTLKLLKYDIFNKFLELINDNYLKRKIILSLIIFIINSFCLQKDVIEFLIKKIIYKKIRKDDSILIMQSYLKKRYELDENFMTIPLNLKIDYYNYLNNILNVDYEIQMKFIIKNDKIVYFMHLIENKCYEIKNINILLDSIYFNRAIMIYYYLYKKNYIINIDFYQIIKMNSYILFEKIISKHNLNKNDIKLVECASSNQNYINILKYLLKKEFCWNESIYYRVKKYGYSQSFMDMLFNKKYMIK